MNTRVSERCHFCPTPVWLVLTSLAVTGLLSLSERWRWFWFNEKKGWTVLVALASLGVVLLLMLLWFVVALLFRFRFQFSIRSLLIMGVAVACPCSWLAVEMKAAREQKQAVEVIHKLDANGKLIYDWQLASDGSFLPYAQPPGPVWLRNLLGDDFVGWVSDLCLAGSEVNDATMERIKGLTTLHVLRFMDTPVTDAGLEDKPGSDFEI